MEQVYNKLVRDNIPEIIKKNNGEPYTRILDEKEYKEELEKKLYEEYSEVIKAKDSKDRIEELADMLEVIRALASVENKNLDDIIEVSKIKREKRGGFEKRIFLERVIEEK